MYFGIDVRRYLFIWSVNYVTTLGGGASVACPSGCFHGNKHFQLITKVVLLEYILKTVPSHFKFQYTESKDAFPGMLRQAEAALTYLSKPKECEQRRRDDIHKQKEHHTHIQFTL